jgi:hypothetical protein
VERVLWKLNRDIEVYDNVFLLFYDCSDIKHLLINYAVSIFIVMYSALKYRERRKNYGTVETKSLQLAYMNILNVLTQKKI